MREPQVEVLNGFPGRGNNKIKAGKCESSYFVQGKVRSDSGSCGLFLRLQERLTRSETPGLTRGSRGYG